MRKRLFLLSSFILLLLLSKISGQNYRSVEISWTCMGKDSFIVKLDMYQDCNNLFKPSYLHIKAKCSSPSLDTSITVTLVSSADVTPTCSSLCTRCQSSGCSWPYGVEKYTLTGLMVLNNTSCCKITLSYLICCRDPDITTGMTWAFLYTEAILDRCLSPCDQSPQFANIPVAMMCVGQDFNYNFGTAMIGSTGDSFVYSMASPMQAAGSLLFYTTPYDYNRPVYFEGFPAGYLAYPKGFHLDSLSGNISFRPMKNQVTVMSLIVSQFRNKVKIGQVRREIELIVINCPSSNHSPILSSTSYSKEVCAGTRVSFTITTNDLDSTDTLTISYNKAIRGAAWADDNGLTKHPTGRFVWSPTDSDVNHFPVTFTVTVNDHGCPVPLTYSRDFQIIVDPVPEATIAVADSGCGKYYFKAKATKGTSPYFLWTGSGFTFKPPNSIFTKSFFSSPGKYPWSMTITSLVCSNTYYDTLNVDTFLVLKPLGSCDICKGSKISLSPQVLYHRGHLRYLWSTSSTDTLKNKSLIVSSDTLIRVRVTDASNCAQWDTIRIRAHSKPIVNAGADQAFCNFSSTKLIAKYSFDRSKKNVLEWTRYPFKSILSNKDTLVAIDTGMYICQLFDTLGCYNSDTVKVICYPVPVAGFKINKDSQCLNGNVFQFTNKTSLSSGAFISSWDFGDGVGNSNVKNPVYSYKKEGKYFVRLIVFSDKGCSDTLTQPVYILKNPVVDLGKDTNIADTSNLRFDAGAGHKSYHWQDNSTGQTYFFNGKTAGAGKHLVSVSIADSNGCGASDTVFINVTVVTAICLSSDLKIKIYPNPANTELNVEVNRNGLIIDILDLTGRKVLKRKLFTGLNLIDLKDLPAGFYLIRSENFSMKATNLLIQK